MKTIRLNAHAEIGARGSDKVSGQIASDRSVSASTAALTVRPIRLWLVDDSAEIRRLCVELFKSYGGFECARQFGSAEEVIATLQQTPGPEVMLLDVSMPGLNGAAAVKTIKWLSPETAVFMFSSVFDPARMAEARAGGASGFLRKSERFAVVAQTLRAAVHPTVPTASTAPNSRGGRAEI